MSRMNYRLKACAMALVLGVLAGCDTAPRRQQARSTEV